MILASSTMKNSEWLALGMFTILACRVAFEQSADAGSDMGRSNRVKVSGGAKRVGAIRLQGDRKGMEMHAIQFQLNTGPTKRRDVNVILLFSPDGHYWWTTSRKENFTKNIKIFSVGEKTVGFSFLYPNILVRETSERAKSLAEATERIQNSIESSIPDLETNGSIELYRKINLVDVVGPHALRPLTNSAPNAIVGLVEVQRDDRSWLLSLEGAGAEPLRVSLDSTYRILDATRAGESIRKSK